MGDIRDKLEDSTYIMNQKEKERLDKQLREVANRKKHQVIVEISITHDTQYRQPNESINLISQRKFRDVYSDNDLIGLYMLLIKGNENLRQEFLALLAKYGPQDV